jgi:hypothetical protein
MKTSYRRDKIKTNDVAGHVANKYGAGWIKLVHDNVQMLSSGEVSVSIES